MRKILYVFIFCVTLSNANDLIVDGDGLIPDSYLTITEALSVAQEGDRIMIAPCSFDYDEDLVINKSVSIFPYDEGGHFFLQGHIAINLDDVQEFTMIGGWIDGVVYANLLDDQRTENTTVNLIECVFLRNVYLNKITCTSNIIHCARFFNKSTCAGENFSPENNIWAGHQNIIGQYSEYFQSGYSPVYVYEPTLWTDFFESELNAASIGGAIHGQLPSISINSGNFIGSVTYNLYIGDGSSWGNSPIENDRVNIIASSMGFLIYNNPSFYYTISNNDIHMGYNHIEPSASLNNLNSNPFSDMYIYEYLTDVLSSSLPTNNNTYYLGRPESMLISSSLLRLAQKLACDYNDFPCEIVGAWDNGSPLNTGDVALLHILNHNNGENENIISNNYLREDDNKVVAIIIDNTNSSLGNMLIANNYFGTTNSIPEGPIFLEEYDASASKGIFFNNSVDNYGSFDFNGFIVNNLYDKKDVRYLIDAGNPSYRWRDLDLTVNDIGIMGGSHPWTMYHDSSGGKGRIFWLNLPNVLSNPENFQIKAKGTHLK